ncbi:hypothetical protein Tco_0748321 [Tanacetum coccineum]|uniref:Uncharacterized protein n=1 Tax=Tanacetum coccineum TaxID=301880 RepID=A0ABQ4YVH8_9ASTR
MDQEKKDNVNSINNDNASSINEVNVVGSKTSIELLDDPNMPELEDIVYSNDDEDVSVEADINNLDAFMPASLIPTTRVHKDHPIEQIIRDLNSTPQTRRIIKNLEEHGLFSLVAALKFADSHNMVAFLAKPTESEVFKHTIDFLNVNPIKYALMMNSTIYTSCIEKFWATTKVKIVNEEVQLQAQVDRKKVIITEASVRRDLQLEDAEGIESLPNAAIFEQLALMGYEKLSQKLTFYKAFFSPRWKFLIHTILQYLSAKSTAWNEFSIIMASAIICLATNQKFNFSKYIFESMVKNLDGSGKFLMYPSAPTEPIADKAVYEARDDSLERAATTATSLDREHDRGGGPRHQDTMRDTIAQTRTFTGISTHFDTDLDMFGVHDLDGDEVVLNTYGCFSGEKCLLQSKDKVETNYELAQRLQAEEQEELTIEEKTVLVEESSKKVKAEIAQESSSKRAGEELE